MINFKNFTDLSQDELEMVLKWRNDERVNAYVEHKFVQRKEHFAFAKSLENDKSKRYFLVYDDEKPIGVVSFVGISDDECEFGIYQDPDLRGFGRVLLSELARYAFEVLGVQRLNARTFLENSKAMRLFLNFGFAITTQDEKMAFLTLSARSYHANGGGGGASLARLANSPALNNPTLSPFNRALNAEFLKVAL